MTDAEIDQIADAVPVDRIGVHATTWHRRFARAVLASHLARPEPVAYGMPRADGLILDVISPEENESYPGEYTVPLYAALAAPQPEPVAWQGAEEWESLAWELCADENGEGSCNELIWEGGPIKEPWGERWLKYEDEAKRLIALVRKHVASPPAAPADMVMVPLAFVQGFHTLAHNYSLRAVPPIYYTGTEGDAFSAAYALCGQDLARLRAMIAAAPAPAAPLTDEQIEQAITAAVKSGACPWMGYKKDENGEYTLPVLSGIHYGIARAIEQAHGIGGDGNG